MRTLFVFLLGLSLIGSPSTSGAAEVRGAIIADERTEKAVKDAEKDDEGYIEQLKRLVDELTKQAEGAGKKGKEMTEKGKKAAEDTKMWLKKDFGKIGDWEYTQAKVAVAEIGELDEKLNELGAERWECFWIFESKGSIHLMFKRPAVSYLRKLSQIDFMKAISTMTGGGDGAE